MNHYKPCEWISLDVIYKDEPLIKLYWVSLSENTRAINLLKENPDKINWSLLSGNPHPAAIELLKENPDKIDWIELSKNPAAMELLKQNTDKIDWTNMCQNTSLEAIKLIKMHYENNTNLCDFTLFRMLDIFHLTPEKKKIRISWFYLSINPAAVDFLREYPRKIIWQYLCMNPSPDAIKLLEENPDKICWTALSKNPAAMELLKKNPDKIDWQSLSINPAPEAIQMLRKHPTKINYIMLARNTGAYDLFSEFAETKYEFFINNTLLLELIAENPAAIPFIERHYKEIKWNMNVMSWYKLLSNPAIFTYDYAAMRAAPMGAAALHADFVAWWWSPRRVAAFLGEGREIDELDEM